MDINKTAYDKIYKQTESKIRKSVVLPISLSRLSSILVFHSVMVYGHFIVEVSPVYPLTQDT